MAFGKAKIAILVMISLPACLQASEDWITYVTPGIRLGWDFGDGLTFGGKISVGLLRDADLNESMFFNVTVGFKAPLTNREKFWYREYNFIQANSACKRKPFLSAAAWA